MKLYNKCWRCGRDFKECNCDWGKCETAKK